MSLQADTRVPLTNADGTPLESWQLRDRIALVVHQLLDATDPATAHEVKYGDADDQYTVTVCDPYRWDLGSFRLRVKPDGDELVIDASCEVAE